MSRESLTADATANEVNNLQAVAVGQLSLLPFASGYDFPIHFHRDPVWLHSYLRD